MEKKLFPIQYKLNKNDLFYNHILTFYTHSLLTSYAFETARPTLIIPSDLIMQKYSNFGLIMVIKFLFLKPNLQAATEAGSGKKRVPCQQAKWRFWLHQRFTMG